LRHESKTLEIIEAKLRLERVTEHISDELWATLEDQPELRRYVDDRIDYRVTRTRGAFGRREENADRGRRKKDGER
ncbi:MAG: hypothetical protein RR704_24355, partial [Stenotrophomonas sp.]